MWSKVIRFFYYFSGYPGAFTKLILCYAQANLSKLPLSTDSLKW